MSLLLVLAGIAVGVFFSSLLFRIKNGSFKRLGEQILAAADAASREKMTSAELQAKEKELQQQILLEKTAESARRKLELEEEKLKKREDKMDLRINLVEKRLSEIDKKEAVLSLRRERIEKERKALFEGKKNFLLDLERLSGLTETGAKELLLQKVEREVRREALTLTKRLIEEAKEEGEQEARRIIATAINRFSSPSTTESSIMTISLSSDEIKGRIIGKEGRNIKALESATGVNFLIDETPGAVVISGFDPIRKQIAKMALTDLLQDGRIHPTRIEEVVQKAKETLSLQTKAFGEDASIRAGVLGLHPELILLLGKLKFRYSLGQNVLDHSLEVSHLMGIMASELGLDVALARRIGLLHDIGKAVSHEVEGSHAIIGHDMALRFGETELVANGIGCHHQEMPPKTIEASLASAADAISGARPGARVEAIEHYIKRLYNLESIAAATPGVEKAYALQAGREIRIFVEPDQVDDLGLSELARQVAQKIGEGLSYPGKIKVTVIREKRAVEYAL